MTSQNRVYGSQDKVLLLVVPFLTPLCPPLGICCLKSYLEEAGKNIKTADAISDFKVKEASYEYFDLLKSYVPENKRGHFFNVGLDVLCNHFMSHTRYEDEEQYVELVKIIVERNFFVEITTEQVQRLSAIVQRFYTALEEFILDLIEREKPAVLGLSVYRGTLAASLFTLKLVKEKYPEILTVMGGAIFSQELYPGTPNFEYFLENATYIDKIIIGEGERLFLKLLDGELPAEQKIFTLKDINDEMTDLNTLPAPNFSDFDLNNYPIVPDYNSRGCIYQCSFCAETMYWKRYRKKDPKKLVNEFVDLSEKYGTKLFLLTDCLINPTATHLAEEVIGRGLDIYWDVYIKVDKEVCDRETALLWRKGGFYRARLGIESGSPNMLKIIDKKITVDQIKEAIISLASVGIKTTTYWIAGHPGESEEDFQQTLDLVEELQDYIFEAECDPFRYFYTGQAHSEEWSRGNGNLLLYPADAKDMLFTQSWILNAEPSREVIYERANRFRQHCIKLGIPNPYSVTEIYNADKRWQSLHKNAVPPFLEMKQGTFYDDKNAVKLLYAEKVIDETDFSF